MKKPFLILFFNIIAFIAFSLLAFTPVTVFAQKDGLDCSRLHNGTFYSYPKNSNSSFRYERSDNIQKEINLTTGETAIYEINWHGKCNYSLKYQSGYKKLNSDVADFLENHKLIVKVIDVNSVYCVYEVHADKLKNPLLSSDTLWFSEKQNVPDNIFFEPIRENSKDLKSFKDTSSYALLYIYRKGKFVCSLGNYFVYFNNSLSNVSSNESHYVFKILKRGAITLLAKGGSRDSQISIPIQFGKKYYVETSAKFGNCNLATCCSPVLILRDQQRAVDDMEKE
jgi:hypothetical protein